MCGVIVGYHPQLKGLITSPVIGELSLVVNKMDG